MPEPVTALADGFKETHLGPLPHEWVTVQLGELFREVNVRVKDLSAQERQSIPILSMTRYRGLVLQSQKFDHRVASRDTSNYKVVKFGQLVVGFPIDEGVIAILHRYQSGAVSPAYNVWKLNREVDHFYLDWFLKTPQLIAVYRQLSSRTVHRRRSLSKTDFKRITIPLPPLPEQRRIARVLSTIQQAIAAQEDLIAAAKETKRSLMQRLLAYGPGVEPSPTKETEIGEIPVHWEVVKFGDLVKIGSGQVDPRKPPYRQMTHIGPADIEEGTGKVLSPKTAEELHLKSGKYLFTSEDVLYSKIRPYLRKAMLPTFTGVCSADMYPLRPKGRLTDRRFLYYILLSDVFTQQVVPHQQRTGIPKINRAQLNTILIPLPGHAREQSAVAEMLDAAEHKIAAEEQRKAALYALFQSMLHQLMTGQTRMEKGDVT